MEHKLETNQYKSLDLFVDDAELVFSNCRLYNPEGSIYHKNATKLDNYLKDQVADYARRGG
jgi:histone acetyltransferase